MSDDNRTPVVTRTNSVFPGSQAPAYGGSVSSGAIAGQAKDAVAANQGGMRGQAGVDDKKKATDKKKAEQKAKQQQATNRRDAADRSRAEAAQRQLYVNGQLVTVYNVFDADGKPQQIVSYGGYRQDGSDHAIGTSTANHAGATRDYAPDALPGLTTYQRGQRDAADQQRQQTYSILSLPEDLSNGTFILGYGQQLDDQGNVPTSGNQDLRVGGTNATQRTAAQKPTVTNAMTVAGGVTWFRQLAHNDPGAYDELVDKLVGSGYLSQDDARHGAYTIKAGQAAGLAMIDAAQNMESGGTDDLRTFLQKQADDVAENTKKARAAAYTPVTRQYTDPAALAQVARSEAEKLLGRSLTDQEAQAFADKFKGLETQKYDAIDSAGRAGGSATVTDPDATGQAEALIRSPQYDTERTKQMTGGYMDALKQLIGG